MKRSQFRNFALASFGLLTLVVSTTPRAHAFVIVEYNTRNDPALHRRLFSGPKALALWVIPGMILAGTVPGGGLLAIAVDNKSRAGVTARLTQKMTELGASEREASDLAVLFVNAQIDDGEGTQTQLPMEDILKAAPTFAKSPGFANLIEALTIRQ